MSSVVLSLIDSTASHTHTHTHAKQKVSRQISSMLLGTLRLHKSEVANHK